MRESEREGAREEEGVCMCVCMCVRACVYVRVRDDECDIQGTNRERGKGEEGVRENDKKKK